MNPDYLEHQDAETLRLAKQAVSAMHDADFADVVAHKLIDDWNRFEIIIGYALRGNMLQLQRALDEATEQARIERVKSISGQDYA